jgi:hypothetical protein
MFWTAVFGITGVVDSAPPSAANTTLTNMPIFSAWTGLASSLLACAVRVAGSRTMGRKASGSNRGAAWKIFATKDNPSRQIHRPDEVDLDQTIQAGEKFVRDWQV